jgi:hypothetical protein
MLLHCLFFAIYLAALSWCADRYHKNLKKIGNFAQALKHPDAKKELIWKEKDAASKKLEQDKKKSRWLIALIAVIHELFALLEDARIIDLNISSRLLNLDVIYNNWFFPIPSLILCLLILQVIFWLKGKGGGVPHNKGINRLFTGRSW